MPIHWPEFHIPPGWVKLDPLLKTPISITSRPSRLSGCQYFLINQSGQTWTRDNSAFEGLSHDGACLRLYRITACTLRHTLKIVLSAEQIANDMRLKWEVNWLYTRVWTKLTTCDIQRLKSCSAHERHLPPVSSLKCCISSRISNILLLLWKQSGRKTRAPSIPSAPPWGEAASWSPRTTHAWANVISTQLNLTNKITRRKIWETSQSKTKEVIRQMDLSVSINRWQCWDTQSDPCPCSNRGVSKHEGFLLRRIGQLDKESLSEHGLTCKQ